MQRDVLLLTEMIDAAEQAHRLTADITVSQLEADRQRRDALLWNFTVLGEASGPLSAEVKDKFPDMPWQQPIRLRNRIVHGYWSIDLEVLHTTATRATTRIHSQLAHRPAQRYRQHLIRCRDSETAQKWRNWVRTSGPSLVRRSFPAAGRRLVSPEEPTTWTDLLWMSP